MLKKDTSLFIKSKKKNYKSHKKNIIGGVKHSSKNSINDRKSLQYSLAGGAVPVPYVADDAFASSRGSGSSRVSADCAGGAGGGGSSGSGGGCVDGFSPAPAAAAESEKERRRVIFIRGLSILASLLGLSGLVKYGKSDYNYFYKSTEKNNALQKLIKNPELFDTINPIYTKEKDFCLNAILQNIKVFNYINNNLKNNEDFLLEAIILQNNILSLMIENEDFSEILKKPSFINKLKIINTVTKEFTLMIKDLDNNLRRGTPKKGTPKKSNT